MSSLAGQTFAGYEIICELGKGGMGAVYKARQPMLNRFVALKMMAPSLSGDPAFVARFIREASAAANLNHPNMVQVYTAGENDQIYYIAMEFVEGESLRVRLDRMGRIPAQEAVAITVYVAQALQYAWNKAHLIHRDIKPDNIFLSNAGEVKVGDLGLAKSVGGEATDVTQTGMLMGSPHYISPEQAQAAKDLDFRTDIYSLGCTLYHMLTGRTPYEGDSPMAVVMKHVNEPAPAIFKVWPACPMPLGRLVGRMVAKRRQERHASYEELVADLMQLHEKLRQSESIAPVATTPAPATVAETVPKAKATDAGVTTRAKAGNQKLVYAATGLCATVVLAGLLWWSPWKAREEASGKEQADAGLESRLQAEPTNRPPAKAGTPAAVPAEPPRQEKVVPITSPAPAPSSAPITQPAAAAVTPAPVHPSGKHLVLFDGKDISAWKDRRGEPGPWKILEDGSLETVPRTGDIATEQKFRDFHIHLEFWLPKLPPNIKDQARANSGIFLQGLYEIQVLDSYNNPTSPMGGCGAIFKIKDPDNADAAIKPPETWNTYDITFRAARLNAAGNKTENARVTLLWNGVKVHDNAEIPGPTLGNKGKEGDAGPIRLQDHGGKVRYRNIWIQPLDDGVPTKNAAAPTSSVPSNVAAAPEPDGFQPIFNGRDLTGWSPREVAAEKGTKLTYQPATGGWEVRNGELVCVSGSGSDLSQTAGKNPPTFFLKSDGEYGNFILQLEFKLCPNGHSGLYIRCSEAGNRNISVDGWMKIPILAPAYAGRMPRSPKYRTGAIAFAAAGPEPSLRATGQWNSMEVRCEGDSVEVTVNGTRTATANMSQEPKLRNCPRSGYIAIANWCCEANGMSFRNIRIKELDAASSAPVTPHSSLVTPADDTFAREVAALPAAQQVARVAAKLKELNPNFDGKQTHKVEGGAVTELAISTVGLRNLAPVSALKQLKKLTVAPWVANQKGVLADLSPLRELPLAWLYCQNNPISDLSPLKGLPLTVLGCGGTQVSDLSPLTGMKLTVLSINDTAVGDLSPLSGMPLTTLWCNNTKVTDLSPLANSPLQELRCDYIPQRDAGALRGIPTLRKLNDQPAAVLLKQAAVSTAGGDIRVLIVTGVDLPAHDWRSTGPALRNELQKDPRMKVEILNDIYRLDSMDLTKFQAVLLNFYTKGKPDPNEQARENLKNLVSRGGGLVIFHSTCGSFRDWPEFRDLAGKVMGQGKLEYDKQGPMRVKITNVNHPITRGMQPYETNDELYAFLSGRKAVQVLATARAKSTGSDEPMAFVFDYGKGRVFHFVLGHDVRAIQTDGTAELLRRGTAWAAGREPVPLTTPQRPALR